MASLLCGVCRRSSASCWCHCWNVRRYNILQHNMCVMKEFQPFLPTESCSIAEGTPEIKTREVWTFEHWSVWCWLLVLCCMTISPPTVVCVGWAYPEDFRNCTSGSEEDQFCTNLLARGESSSARKVTSNTSLAQHPIAKRFFWHRLISIEEQNSPHTVYRVANWLYSPTTTPTIHAKNPVSYIHTGSKIIHQTDQTNSPCPEG